MDEKSYVGDLPTGERCYNKEIYVAAWVSLAAKVTTLFPGWRLYAFDPWLSLIRTTRPDQVLDLPIEFALRIAEIHDKVEPQEMALCEATRLFVRPDTPYIFRVIDGCGACKEADVYSKSDG